MANIVRSDPFEDLLRGFFVRPVDYGMFQDAPAMKVVKESGDTFKVHAELPGVRKDDIHVQIEGSTVSITAERKQEHELRSGDRILRSERSFGRIVRSFDLGAPLDEAGASARFADGVLELVLPHRAVSQARKLAIS